MKPLPNIYVTRDLRLKKPDEASVFCLRRALFFSFQNVSHLLLSPGELTPGPVSKSRKEIQPCEVHLGWILMAHMHHCRKPTGIELTWPEGQTEPLFPSVIKANGVLKLWLIAVWGKLYKKCMTGSWCDEFMNIKVVLYSNLTIYVWAVMFVHLLPWQQYKHCTFLSSLFICAVALLAWVPK